MPRTFLVRRRRSCSTNNSCIEDVAGHDGTPAKRRRNECRYWGVEGKVIQPDRKSSDLKQTPSISRHTDSIQLPDATTRTKRPNDKATYEADNTTDDGYDSRNHAHAGDTERRLALLKCEKWRREVDSRGLSSSSSSQSVRCLRRHPYYLQERRSHNDRGSSCNRNTIDPSLTRRRLIKANPGVVHIPHIMSHPMPHPSTNNATRDHAENRPRTCQEYCPLPRQREDSVIVSSKRIVFSPRIVSPKNLYLVEKRFKSQAMTGPRDSRHYQRHGSEESNERLSLQRNGEKEATRRDPGVDTVFECSKRQRMTSEPLVDLMILTSRPHLDEDASHLPNRGRLLANLLERKRVAELNDAFNRLRHIVPMYGNEDRNLSKIKTLRYAITYISQLDLILKRLPFENGCSESNGHTVITKNPLLTKPQQEERKVVCGD